MSNPVLPQPDPSSIGGVNRAPFALLPDPGRLFARRAERFDGLAAAGPLAPYLRFLADLSRVQDRIVADRPRPAPIPAEQRDRARDHAMPPLDRGTLAADDELHATLDALFAGAAAIAMPPVAAEALAAAQGAGRAGLATMVGNLAADAVPFDALAAHLFVAAGVQVHAAGLAAALEPSALVPVGTGLCPVCGAAPVASVVVGVAGAEGTRYGVCCFCATLWNEVRIKCLACGSTKGIGYRAVEADGAQATVKAEVCDACRSWLKILYQNRNASLEAVADDVGTLALDLLMRETDYRRAGLNPFLLGC